MKSLFKRFDTSGHFPDFKHTAKSQRDNKKIRARKERRMLNGERHEKTNERISKVKNEETDKWIDAHCPWYLGRWKVSDDCDKTCPITVENRDTSMCPECYNDDFD